MLCKIALLRFRVKFLDALTCCAYNTGIVPQRKGNKQRNAYMPRVLTPLRPYWLRGGCLAVNDEALPKEGGQTFRVEK